MLCHYPPRGIPIRDSATPGTTSVIRPRPSPTREEELRFCDRLQGLIVKQPHQACGSSGRRQQVNGAAVLCTRPASHPSGAKLLGLPNPVDSRLLQMIKSGVCKCDYPVLLCLLWGFARVLACIWGAARVAGNADNKQVGLQDTCT